MENFETDKKFKNVGELMDFVLVECGDFKLNYDYGHLKISNTDLNVGGVELVLTDIGNFNEKYVIYLSELLKKQFNTKLSYITFSNFSEEMDFDLQNLDIYGIEFHHTDISNLILPPNLTLLVMSHCEIRELRLPDKIKHIFINDDDYLESFFNLPDSVEVLKVKNCEKFKMIDKLPKNIKSIHIDSSEEFGIDDEE